MKKTEGFASTSKEAVGDSLPGFMHHSPCEAIWVEIATYPSFFSEFQFFDFTF